MAIELRNILVAIVAKYTAGPSPCTYVESRIGMHKGIARINNKSESIQSRIMQRSEANAKPVLEPSRSCTNASSKYRMKRVRPGLSGKLLLKEKSALIPALNSKL